MNYTFTHRRACVCVIPAEQSRDGKQHACYLPLKDLAGKRCRILRAHRGRVLLEFEDTGERVVTTINGIRRAR